ncbi:unnamed protein product [Moneuplotes crassus]|uniref:Uncharacterized protein n=1 Tax=Euplotes crassus TaxID=5936 RepID=A0AAD1Y278_EUPCR|nr:unnamed protein product [Moneuplotes crassus]
MNRFFQKINIFTKSRQWSNSNSSSSQKVILFFNGIQKVGIRDSFNKWKIRVLCICYYSPCKYKNEIFLIKQK